jgi:hypothetical protein
MPNMWVAQYVPMRFQHLRGARIRYVDDGMKVRRPGRVSSPKRLRTPSVPLAAARVSWRPGTCSSAPEICSLKPMAPRAEGWLLFNNRLQRPNSAESPMPLYWLCYRHNNQISVVIEPGASIVDARLRASLHGLDEGTFTEGHELDRKRRVPKAMLLAHYPFNSLHDWHFEILFIVAIIIQLIHILLEAL